MTIVLSDLLSSQFDFSYYGFVCFDCAKYLCDGCASFVEEELEPDHNGDKLCCKCKSGLEKRNLTLTIDFDKTGRLEAKFF